MKAFRNPLGQRVLADPRARDQLRRFLTSPPPGAQDARSTEILIEVDGKVYRPVYVPPAG